MGEHLVETAARGTGEDPAPEAPEAPEAPNAPEAPPDAPAAPDALARPPRPTCAWCGSTRLRPAPRTSAVQRLRRCAHCAHTFRAPHERGADPAPLRVPDARHRERARMLLPYGEPESWLDVGTGGGQFPAVARATFPYTAFDGLDVDPARLTEARERGRIDEAHHGSLVSALPALAGRYDTVSLFHHLEGSADPQGELAAATKVLRPGGYLLVEAWDPRSALGALLGAHWRPYHRAPVHLVPCAGLQRALRELGLDVVTVQRTAAHLPGDLRAAVARLPLPAPVRLAARPVTGAAGVLDLLLAPLARRSRLATTYRVLARRR